MKNLNGKRSRQFNLIIRNIFAGFICSKVAASCVSSVFFWGGGLKKSMKCCFSRSLMCGGAVIDAVMVTLIDVHVEPND